MTTTPDRTLTAALAILAYALLIGFTDNFVRVVAVEAGLWQFHAVRAVMALALLGLAAQVVGLDLRPLRPGAVVARSVIHATAMLIYFGCLAFLPVAQVAAGLFTAPIFVLLISRFAFGEPIGPVRVVAVMLGFAGVLMLLGRDSLQEARLAALLPVISGALYAFGNIVTREWCAQERAETLLAGFFMALGVMGLVGMGVLALVAPEVPAGTAGFVLRGAVWPGGEFYLWTFVQAAGSLLGVGLMIKAYLIASASRVSIFEYIILPASALWGWVIWDEVLDLGAWIGMAMIAGAGAMIALRSRQLEPEATPLS
ncbi:DMT family transporter [Szabonella alba]|uniref:DMT family transporter n=1 Tax=Szabonella alba TaxID=2804194 RepID=A0A8K0VDG8_9RHOB|nr:DMT family transporter [Szabonella alba]MBL4918178.1 DMT family transporter [Szabonella alba]